MKTSLQFTVSITMHKARGLSILKLINLRFGVKFLRHDMISGLNVMRFDSEVAPTSSKSCHGEARIGADVGSIRNSTSRVKGKASSPVHKP